MSKPGAFRRWLDSRSGQWIQFGLGLLLLAGAAVVGPIPGPGGIVFAAAGLTLLLRSSLWARRHYVRFKRWQPRAGGWMDRALRRQSAKRRRERDGQAGAAAVAGGGLGDLPAPQGFEPVPIDPAAVEIEPARPGHGGRR
ncbi:hypothetical protein [Sphingomonas ginkgonis]|uniref:hypothetical protein n=1 Tax=Sphingomonas ginkgonis TaxID=2315330 RepID=UPI00163A350C|nr:hypothetical protein [Sphingomonas ginkgonis]